MWHEVLKYMRLCLCSCLWFIFLMIIFGKSDVVAVIAAFFGVASEIAIEQLLNKRR